MGEVTRWDLIQQDPDYEGDYAKNMRGADERFAKDGDKDKLLETQLDIVAAYIEQLDKKIQKLEAQGNEMGPDPLTGETKSVTGGYSGMFDIIEKIENLKRRKGELERKQASLMERSAEL